MEDYPDKETMNQWSNDPSNWIWSTFYFNKLDARILVPKRVPALGVTINFANPKSGLFVIGLIIVLTCLIKLLS